MGVTVEHLADLPPEPVAALVTDSERAGWRLVRRLSDDWAAGANRFDGLGESLFAAWASGQLLGVCGLNVDPYTADREVGRVRHLYVHSAFRRRGIGRRLVQAVVEAAQGRFALLRLRTECPQAAAFYERLGFRRQVGVPDCTHALGLASGA